MGGRQEAFRSLGPIDWEDVPHHELGAFLDEVVTEAHITADSIPSATSSSATSEGPESKLTEPNAPKPNLGQFSDKTSRLQWPTQEAIEKARELQSDWKEIKVNARENPLNVQVYKLASKDGRGAWFARRSTHQDLTFEQWRDALDNEFIESIKVQKGPGSGAIRGIGADRRVEHRNVPNAGNVNVFQLSAQFPGPTAPRDFITLLLTSERSTTAYNFPRPLRQYIIVSKPCTHNDARPRQGIIRGQYESIELIREVPTINPSDKNSLSTPNLLQGKQTGPDPDLKSSASDAGNDKSEPPVAIEWLMVTRSDPGGSVPRFMIEKGTPPGIVNDAGKFLTWARRRSGNKPDEAPAAKQDTATATAAPAAPKVSSHDAKNTTTKIDEEQTAAAVEQEDESWGLWGMVTGAFGAASSVVSGGLKWQFSGAEEEEDKDDSESESLTSSETSSINSFASALEGSQASYQGSKSQPISVSDMRSEGKLKEHNSNQHKELRRLEERLQRLDAKVAKIAEEREGKLLVGKEKEAAALAKSREKHEREIAKQEAKYRNQVKKLEQRREQAERKAEQRRKKAEERERANDLKLMLNKARAERDIALKKVQLLETRVGELQTENTRLKAGGKFGGESDSSSSNLTGKRSAKS